jgi:hypothetical protein
MSVSLRMFGGAALAALGLVSGCGTQPSPPGAEQHVEPRREPAREAPPVKPPPLPSPAASLTAALVDQAFGGAAPAFPLLASNGNQVTMGVASPIGGSAVATYRVITFSNWTNMTDAWGSSAVDEPIVDATMTTMLLDRAMGEPAPLPDPRLLAERAAAVTRRLRAGGFTPFDGAAIAIGVDDTSVGPVKLRTAHGGDAELIVHLLDATDRELAVNTIQPHATGLVADLACVATPVARRAWLDARRKRILVEVGWHAGADGCTTPDPEYGMWPTP